jgi:steroid delta-isomerase-like uncharacterized protein
MTSNKAAVRRLHEAMGGGVELLAQTIDDLVMPDVAFRPPVPTGDSGAAALKQVLTALHRAFPDLHVTVEELIEEDDTVVARNSVTGTNQGDYLGMPPTGRPVRYDEIFIFRFIDGRITEIRGVVDVFSQLKQLGRLPG